MCLFILVAGKSICLQSKQIVKKEKTNTKEKKNPKHPEAPLIIKNEIGTRPNQTLN